MSSSFRVAKPGPSCCSRCSANVTESGSTLVTTNLPFDEWIEVFGSERLTGPLLDLITHHVHILEMNGDSYRLSPSQNRRKPPKF